MKAQRKEQAEANIPKPRESIQRVRGAQRSAKRATQKGKIVVVVIVVIAVVVVVVVIVFNVKLSAIWQNPS